MDRRECAQLCGYASRDIAGDESTATEREGSSTGVSEAREDGDDERELCAIATECALLRGSG